MSAERATYIDSSAIVKLTVREAESTALRAHLRRRRPVVSSALARTEVLRALLPFGETVMARGVAVLGSLELIRMSDRVLIADESKDGYRQRDVNQALRLSERISGG